MREISINKEAIRYAAEHIYTTNMHLRTWSYGDIYDAIKEHVRLIVTKAYDNWELTYISSGGWTVEFHPECAEYGSIEVLVDPCVSKGYDYVNVEDVI